MGGWIDGREFTQSQKVRWQKQKKTHIHDHSNMNLFEYVKLCNERQEHEIMHAKQQRQKTPIGKTRDNPTMATQVNLTLLSLSTSYPIMKPKNTLPKP
jgi:hypothetical protein